MQYVDCDYWHLPISTIRVMMPLIQQYISNINLLGLSLFIRNSDTSLNMGWKVHIWAVWSSFWTSRGGSKALSVWPLTYQVTKLMLLCCFATKMEDNSKQSRPERTIMTPKHLRSSTWKYFGVYTVDGKVTMPLGFCFFYWCVMSSGCGVRISILDGL